MSLIDLAAAEQQQEQAEWAALTPIQRLQRRLSEAQREVNAVEAEIAVMQGSCHHTWDEPIYTPYVRPRIGPTESGTYVPEFKRETWTRYCKTCGVKQETTQAKEQTLKVPIFSEPQDDHH